MTNCRPTSGIVPVMVPLKGVPVVGACVLNAPSLYTHVPFRYARLMYQLLFRVPRQGGQVERPGRFRLRAGHRREGGDQCRDTDQQGEYSPCR